MRKTLFFLVITLALAGVVVLLAVRKTAKEAPPTMTADARAVAAAANDFGFRLLAEIRKERNDENVFFSPLSLSMALSMTYNGAAGATKTGMAQAMGVQGMAAERLNAGQRTLLGFTQREDLGVTTGIANALWTKKGARLLPEFIKQNRQYYRARVTALNLANPRSAGVINGWVSRETKGKIDNLVQPCDFDDTSRLVLTNAMYFNALWHTPFNRSLTEDGPFTLDDGTNQQVPMMTRTDYLHYFDGDGFRAVRLPYGGFEWKAMYILLPDAKQRLADLIPKLTAKNWDRWMGHFTEERVNIFLPRFTATYESQVNEPLIALGMGDAFSMERADFSGMDGRKDNLYISLVRHKAVLEVSEERTEAAAATSVHAPATAIAPSPPKDEPIIFRVDHPFLCVIRDEESGGLLFLGAIEKPE
ncbi:MAG: serpin family protein [Armatimonadota bacterium]